MKKSNSMGRVIALAALMSSSGMAMADGLSYAIGYAPDSVPVLAADAMAKYSAEHGGPSIEVFPMTLLNIKETPPGIRDGVVDMGFNAHAVFSAEYPNANLPAEFGVLATNATPPSNALWAPAAMAGAITEYIMLECPECQAEFAKEGQVYLSGQSSPAYSLHCSAPVNSVEALKGKQLRTPSGYWARWVEAMGGVSVFMSANEAFNALSQGVVDCVVIHPADLITLRLIDIVKATTLGVPQGVFSGASVANINKDVWKGLPVEQRKALLEAAAFMNASMTFGAAQQAATAIAEEKTRGITVLEADADLKAATDEFIKGLRDVVIAEYSEKLGVTDTPAKVDKIEALIAKWVGLTKDAATADDMFKIYMSEIYAKVDVNAYGL
jgi:TRAP-type C4-dicarboxylate transport system substrate-binding protein